MGLLFFCGGRKIHNAADLFANLPDGATMKYHRFVRLKGCFPSVEQPEKFVDLCNKVWSSCVLPGCIAVVDECLWKARHIPKVEDKSEIIKMDRKPGGMGLINFLLCLMLGQSGLPFALFSTPVRWYDRISSGSACIKLMQLRLKHPAAQQEIHLYIDSAFSSKEVRHFLKCAHICARQINPLIDVHYTCSANKAWDPIWKVAHNSLKINMFRVFRKVDAAAHKAELASVFSMRSPKGKQIYVRRFTNAYCFCGDTKVNHTGLFNPNDEGKAGGPFTEDMARLLAKMDVKQLRQILKLAGFECR